MSCFIEGYDQIREKITPRGDGNLQVATLTTI